MHAPHLLEQLAYMPAGMILFPRRMLYVEAVLYVLIAATSFSLGYLVARNSSSNAANTEAGASAADSLAPLEGTVMVDQSGKKQPNVGAVVIVLPADKSLKPLSAARFRPGEAPAGSDDLAMHDLAAFGGAMARIGADGSFHVSVPRPGSYRVLVVSPHGTREPGGDWTLDQRDLGKYFDDPTELVRKNPYKWSKDVRPGTNPVDVEFSE
jgi:hypothetical protein